MTDFDPSPFDCGGSALSDSAWNLAATLQQAREGETEQAATLRTRLCATALQLAESWFHERANIAASRALTYHRALWQLRDLAVELGSNPVGARTGLRVVVDAFCRQFLPNALVALRPAGLATLVAREQLETLEERLAELGIEQDAANAGPDRLLVVRFPQGEQDNTLMACCVLPHFNRTQMRHIFATATAGPAYFFARAAELQNSKGFSDSFDPPRLCFIGELLQISGWLEHPQIGPLILRWQEHFGFGTNYLDTRIQHVPTLRQMRDAQEAYRETPPAYTPVAFDEVVPAMWEQLRRLRPPTGAADAPRQPDVIDIMNAGWSFAQAHLDDLYAALSSHTAQERYSARRILNRLMADAIDAATQTFASVQ